MATFALKFIENGFQLKGYENEKSLPPYVWNHRNRLTRCTTTPFDSVDTLGPKQVSQSHQMHQEANKNFFAHFKAKHVIFLTALLDAKHTIFHSFL